jgi:hypothetical protein
VPRPIRVNGGRQHFRIDPAPPYSLRSWKSWAGLLEVVDGSQAGFDPARAGVTDGGVVLARPDRMIGFRAIPTDDAGIAALKAHLLSYLVPRSLSANASASQVPPVAAIG